MQRRPTVQDISWFLDLNRNKQLELSPRYQRRSVWTNSDRRFFLDTIFSGYPCPAIFVHKRMTGEGRAIYDVVDGKQRLETILKFVDNKISISSDFHDSLLAGKKWRELGENERKRFWNYSLPVEQLDFDTSDTSAVEEAFDRLNRNSRKLEPQELRHARYEGWFIGTIEKECQEIDWKNFGVVTAARSRRMKDAQFLSELFLVLIEKRQFGFDQGHLDDAYAKYDDPDDEGTELDTDDFTERLSVTKQFLNKMNAVNGCVKIAGSALGSFYSLWSLIVLHGSEILPPEDLARGYADFMAQVARLRAVDAELGNVQLDIQDTLDQQNPSIIPARSYAQAIQGAQTDLNPRETRLKALLQVLKIK